MTLKTSSSQKQLCLRKYQQKYFPLGFFSTNTGYCFLSSFFLPMSVPPAVLGCQVELEEFPRPCGTWGSSCSPPTPFNQSPWMAQLFLSLYALEKFPLQNVHVSGSPLPYSSEWFLRQLILCKNSGN